MPKKKKVLMKKKKIDKLLGKTTDDLNVAVIPLPGVMLG